MTIQESLFALRDADYAVFQAKLTPTVAPKKFIGVRVPALRALAKELDGSEESEGFLLALPHEYYDENMLHAALLNRKKSFENCLAAVERFLPFVDNWAVCDTMHPKSFEKKKELLLPKAVAWTRSEETYTCRYGIGMLMTYFLGEAFVPEVLSVPAEIRSEEYYVNMMVAWHFATALAKQWEAAIPYLETRRLSDRTHNKTIQKARESFRITPEQKEYLKSLKVGKK